MARPWRRIVVPAAALGVIVPAGFAAQALLSSNDSSDDAASAAKPRATATAPSFAGGDSDAGSAVVASPSAEPQARKASSAVRLTSYDTSRHRAVVNSSAGGHVRAGDVVAAAPSRHAPSGALFKVSKVIGSSGTGTEVATAPATIEELLGARSVHEQAPVSADDLRVRVLSPGVTPETGAQATTGPGQTGPSAGTASPTPVPTGQQQSPPSAPSASASASGRGDVPASRSLAAVTGRVPVKPTQGLPRSAATKLATLRLGLNVPLPAGVEATDKSAAKLAGKISFSPELIFEYEKRGGLNILPEHAAVGIGGSYSYDWDVHGKVRKAVDSGEVVTPLAAVTGQHTFWVGPVPVVVNAEVVFSYRLTADGRIVLDAEQHTTGSFALGARYDRAEGWKPVREAHQTTHGGRPQVAGAATATASVGAGAKVYLYDTVGVGGDLSVYLKGRAAAASKGAPAWALSAGYDLKTELMLQLKIFGIRIIDLSTTPFTLHGERKLFGQGTLPAP
ncbi:hypothetical protein ACWCP6_31290 [Streptomyces sp. NPDC002004]